MQHLLQRELVRLSQIALNGSSLGTALTNMLMAEDILPGSAPSYQLAKEIYLFHPLGKKMAESPVKMAQWKPRNINVPDSPEDRIVQAFRDEWKRCKIDDVIFAVATWARVYGIASVGVVCKEIPTDQPIDYKKLSKLDISFNVFDPLNTAGSLVLNQNTDSMDFMKPTDISVNGKTYHRSRACTLMNEQPVYIAYTTSAYGFVGRSVYQRALFPLKTFLQSMLTDDLVTVKVGVLIAKMESPGSIIDNLMSKIWGQKRQLLKDAATGNVLSVGKDDAIESLNFQNMDGPYSLVRTNVLKNTATAADMPAMMLENETLTEGFGEGTEDRKNIAQFIDGVREWLNPLYTFFDKITQYRAWNEEFFTTIKNDFPDYVGNRTYTEVFYEWTKNFVAAWPNLLTEPPSELIKVDDTKLKAIIALVEVLLPAIDPVNKALVIEWAANNFNGLKLLFSDPLNLDYEAIAKFEPPVPLKEPAENKPFAAADAQGWTLRKRLA